MNDLLVTSRQQLSSLPEVQSSKPVQASASTKDLAKGSQADADSRRRAGSRGEKSQSQPPARSAKPRRQRCLPPLVLVNQHLGAEQPLKAKKAQSDPETMDAQDSSVGEQSTKCARQPGSAGVEVAYAGVVAGQLAASKKSLVDGHPAASNQTSGSSTPSAKGAAQSVPVDSMESTNRCPAGPSSNGSGSQGETPCGTTTTAAQADLVVPPGERKNKTPVYITGVSNTRSFLRWFQGKTGGNGTAQMRDESLVLVPDMARLLPGYHYRFVVHREREGCVFSHLLPPRGPDGEAPREESGQKDA